MSLGGYSFISSFAQNIFYVLYISISLYLFYILRREGQIRLPHTVLILLSIVLSVIMLRNAIIALPLLFVLPMLAEKQSHIIVKCVSWITYIGICLFFCLIVLVRFGFARTYILSTEMSPDKKHSASIIVHDEGALGGSIEVQYERLYGGIIKKSRPIYIDRLSEPKIEWIDNYKIQIDDVIINIKDRDVIYRRK